MANFVSPSNQPVEPLPPLYESSGGDEKSSILREAGTFFWETAKVIIISLAIILPIRFYVAQPFYVKGASMEPSFYDHEYLIIDEFSYHFRNPHRGEVVVFRYPENPDQFFIKRVIGLPNERITISQGTIMVYPEGTTKPLLIQEPYLDSSTRTAGDIDLLLQEGEYYVLGDNRSASFDSRSFGPLGRSFVIGRVVFRGWPVNRIDVFSNVQYE